MCGIAGFFDRTGHSSRSDIVSMTDQLEHRGPDGAGYYFIKVQDSATLGLGHRRLSIIDLSSLGDQPMEFSGYFIVFNGEIYNFLEIKRELIAFGYSFSSTSDTEVVLKAFHKWNTGCVEKFIGMFSFAIYDSNQKKILICRDRVGVKPLYFNVRNNSIFFASEIKSIVKSKGFNKNIAKSAVRKYFQYGYIPTPFTIYENVSKLEPGSWLIFDMLTGSYDIRSYWSVENVVKCSSKWEGSFESAIDHAEFLIKDACELRLVSDVPVGVFLSGGYDSTLVASLLQTGRSENIKTFTIGFEEPEFNEAEHARAISNHLGTDHFDLRFSNKDVIDMIPQMAVSFDEPFSDNSAFPTFLLSKFTRNHVKVAISADGGDELFAGYNKYDSYFKYKKFRDRISNIPTNILSEFCKWTLDSKILKNTPAQTKLAKFDDILNSSSAEDLISVFSSIFSNYELSCLLVENQNLKIIDSNYADASNLTRILNFDFQNYLRDDVLVKLDRCTMAFGLEGREPLLDHRIFEWAATLPDDFKYSTLKGKKFLIKELVHKYVPKEIMERPKKGFGIPLEKWMKSHFYFLLDEYLNVVELKKHGILNHNYVEELCHRFKKGDTSLYMKLWAILMFQIWYSKWS
jgi:asparagine synthase (glutamine-hydrolysing)